MNVDHYRESERVIESQRVAQRVTEWRRESQSGTEKFLCPANLAIISHFHSPTDFSPCKTEFLKFLEL